MSTCPVCGKDHDREVSCSDQPRDSRVGQVICDKYRVTRLIGEGGMASVYEARHLTIDRPFALKFLHPWLTADDEWLERFRREGCAGGALVSEHISAILDVGLTHDDAPYILMELLRGEDLGQRLGREGTLKPQDAIEVITQACHGLAVAHRAGVIHRDLKPENIFLCDRELGGVLVKVLDFGIAKLRYAQLTRATKAGMVMGTPYYMSPEQAAGRGGVDHRSDLYSLGVMLYELLSGEKPFVADDHGAVLNKIVASPTPLLSELCPMLSADLSAVVQKAIAKDPSDRFQTAEQFADALLRFWPHTRNAMRTASAFGLSRARRRTEDLGHITSAEPRLTVRVTGTRNADLSPLGVLEAPESATQEVVSGKQQATKQITGAVPVNEVVTVSSEPPAPREQETPEFADHTEPDALLSLEHEDALRSPQTRGAPPKPSKTPPAAPVSERVRSHVGRYHAASAPYDDGSEPPPVHSDRGPQDDTPVPTSVPTVSLGKTLAPLLLGTAAIVLFVASFVSHPEDSARDGAVAAQVTREPEIASSEQGDNAEAPSPAAIPEVEPSETADTEAAEGSGGVVEEAVDDLPTSDADPAAAETVQDGATGTLNVTSNPPATLRIRGEIVGRTPKTALELPVGDYRLELWHDTIGSKFKSVRIHQGTATTVHLDLAAGRRAATQPSATASSRATATQPSSTATSTAPAAGVDPCSPRYHVDAQGVRRIKRECL